MQDFSIDGVPLLACPAVWKARVGKPPLAPGFGHDFNSRSLATREYYSEYCGILNVSPSFEEDR
jgi:hypothetical protein